jgi:hypothetical protein
MSTDGFRNDLLHAVHNLADGAQTYKVLLLNDTFVPAKSYRYVSELLSPTNYELSGTGYTRKTLTSRTLTLDGTNHRTNFDADDVVFTGINAGTIGCICVYRDRGGADSANEILFFIDNADLLTDGSNVTVSWNAAGLYYF